MLQFSHQIPAKSIFESYSVKQDLKMFQFDNKLETLHPNGILKAQFETHCNTYYPNGDLKQEFADKVVFYSKEKDVTFTELGTCKILVYHKLH